MIDPPILQHAKKLWDYHHMNHTLVNADCILVLGSHDTRVAERGAELYLQGWAPLLVFSGGLGNFTKDLWQERKPISSQRLPSKWVCHRKRSWLKTDLLTRERISFSHNSY